MADDSRDLAQAVHEVMVQRFDWFTINDTFSFMLDLAAAGVGLSMEDFVDTSEHGIQLVYAHGNDCEGCQQIQSIAFEAVARNAVREYREHPYGHHGWDS